MENRDYDSHPIHKTLTEAQPDPIIHVVGTVTYSGYAKLGTPLTSDGWKIKRTKTAAGTTITEYADGDMKYDNIWANHASLSYSR